MTDKTFETTLIVDYKNGAFRVSKKPKKIKATEIPVKIKLKVIVPDTPEFKIDGEVTISPIKMSEMMLEAIEDKDNI